MINEVPPEMVVVANLDVASPAYQGIRIIELSWAVLVAAWCNLVDEKAVLVMVEIPDVSTHDRKMAPRSLIVGKSDDLIKREIMELFNVVPQETQVPSLDNDRKECHAPHSLRNAEHKMSDLWNVVPHLECVFAGEAMDNWLPVDEH